MELKTKNLTFAINDDGTGARFITCAGAKENSDFFRLILDDGLRTEIPVFSRDQRGKASKKGDSITVVYDSLVSDYGDTYAIKLTIGIVKEGDLLNFTPAIENNADVRVDECFCPTCFVDKINGDKRNDALYLPYGLGRKIVDPYSKLESLTERYYDHNEQETFMHLHYPQASMCWLGVESDGKFLYMARKDDKIRCCFLSVRHTIRSFDLALCIDHLPMLKKGEKISFAPTSVGLLDGDFRAGADDYRKWADKSFFRVAEKEKWVKEMTGFQRVIMRSQYGEDYYAADDLPQMYLTGKKYGMDTLFLFAWWKEGMDKNYPDYAEPCDGAYAKLKENIRKVREMGGRVILEMNCHFVDPQTEFYKKFGDEVTIKDIYGNEIKRAFVYPGYGEFNAFYGARGFSICCSGSKRWRDQLDKQLRLLDSFEPDCLFADCYGAAPTQPCFDSRHEHGNRIDEEWTGRRKFFDGAVKYCDEQNKVLGTEVVTDIAASYAQFVHGLFNIDLDPKSEQFPALFRYTFPEVITTTRGILGSEAGGDVKIKSALVYGLRIDAQLHACRATVEKDPLYADSIAFVAGKMREYSRFYFDGEFTVRDLSALPHAVKRGEFLSADKTELLTVLYNTSDKEQVAVGKTLAPGEMQFSVTKA